MKTIDLEQFIGKQKLSGVDFGSYRWEDEDDWQYGATSNTINFIIDGQTYTAIEDPEDGYRSSLEGIMIGGECDNTFPEIEVLGQWKGSGDYYDNKTIQFVDTENGKIVLEVGTDYTDSYYPYFVDNFNPKNIHYNEKS